jgi:WD40 repeat protein
MRLCVHGRGEQATHANSQAVEPLATYKGHTSVVEDVAWHTSSPSIFASVGDDKQLLIWDELVPDRTPVQVHGRRDLGLRSVR